MNGTTINIENKTGKKIGATMPVYVLGGFIDVDKLVEISTTYSIPLIKDITEASGSFKNKKHAGTFGLTGVFSFKGNKIISTGGGGMSLTNDKETTIFTNKHIIRFVL